MITGLRGATLWSEDVNNLLPIYQDVVGLPVAVDAPGFVLGQAGGASARARHAQRGTRPQQRSCRHVIGLTTDDITADGKRFKDAGVEFIEDPTDYDTVRAATFNDPEGNLLQLLEFYRVT